MELQCFLHSNLAAPFSDSPYLRCKHELYTCDSRSTLFKGQKTFVKFVSNGNIDTFIMKIMKLLSLFTPMKFIASVMIATKLVHQEKINFEPLLRV